MWPKTGLSFKIGLSWQMYFEWATHPIHAGPTLELPVPLPIPYPYPHSPSCFEFIDVDVGFHASAEGQSVRSHGHGDMGCRLVCNVTKPIIDATAKITLAFRSRLDFWWMPKHKCQAFGLGSSSGCGKRCAICQWCYWKRYNSGKRCNWNTS